MTSPTTGHFDMSERLHIQLNAHDNIDSSGVIGITSSATSSATTLNVTQGIPFELNDIRSASDLAPQSCANPDRADSLTAAMMQLHMRQIHCRVVSDPLLNLPCDWGLRLCDQPGYGSAVQASAPLAPALQTVAPIQVEHTTTPAGTQDNVAWNARPSLSNAVDQMLCLDDEHASSTIQSD